MIISTVILVFVIVIVMYIVIYLVGKENGDYIIISVVFSLALLLLL